jgi:Tfp pilus assembly protein PilO
MTKLRQLWVLTAVGSVLVLAAGYFLLVSPKASKAASIRAEAAAQEQANARLRTQIQMLNRQKKDLPRQQAELQKFAARIPNNPALPALVRGLSNATDNAGIELVSVSPTTPTRVVATAGAGATTAAAVSTATPLALAQIPITIKINGRYSQLSQFFSEVEGLPRAFLISGVSVTPNTAAAAGTTGSTESKSEPDSLTATITGSLYMTVKPLAPTPVAAPVAE